MSELYFRSLLIAGGVCFGFALHAATLALRTRSAPYLHLMWIALLEGAYCVTAHEFLRRTDSQAALPWGQALCAFTPYITYFFGELTLALTRSGTRWLLLFQRLNLGLTLAFSLGVISDAVLGSELMLHPRLETDLASAHRHKFLFTTPGFAYLGWVTLSFALFATLLVRGYRARRDLLPMVMGSIAYFAATIHDFGIVTGNRDFYFVQHFGAFALVAGCWPVLSRRFEQSLVELKEAIARLETQRARLLQVTPTWRRQKLDSLGMLAAGVAHEINNPVQGIMNYAQLIKREVPETHTAYGFAEEIGGESKRVKDIVANLLRFGRADDGSEFLAAGVKDLVGATVGLMQSVLAAEGIALSVNIQEGLPELTCRAQQLQQVFLNLVSNARDAFRGRDPSRTDERKIAIDAWQETRNGEAWVLIEVTDTGSGFDPALSDRIFDPFFTTKPDATGLGLSVSHGIVQAHGGTISCQSRVGKTTRFRVELPCCVEVSNSGRYLANHTGDPSGRSEDTRAVR